MEAVHLICVPLSYQKLLTRLIAKRCLQNWWRDSFRTNCTVHWNVGYLDAIRVLNGMTQWSCLFIVSFGVRQGAVLSPFLFATYLDDLTRSLLTSGMFIVLYADILLISPSACMLDKLLKICEYKLDLLDMVINVNKTWCLRIGPRNNFSCSPISTSKGTVLP